MGIPSLGGLASSIGNAVGAAASKAASVVTQQPAAPAPAPQAAPQAPVDSFEPAKSQPAVCGGNSTSGAQCLPDWGSASGGGGGGAGINPSSR